MATLNSLIQTTRPTVSALVESFRGGDYFVDDNFQRRLVWTTRQKVRLVETILMGFPMPEIYIWQQVANAESGKQRHSIVDGQQRLTTMMQFASNEWNLAKRYLDTSNAENNYADKLWKDLDTETKRRFWDYVVNVRTIPSGVTIDQIRLVFTRLNETDKSLNPQEIRNAEFSGEFIKNAERVADLPEFQELNIFSDHQIRRMADLEFTSGLLIYLRRGLIEEGTKTVNETYDLYNDQYEEAEQDLRHIESFLKRCIDSYLKTQPVRDMFTKPVHLFSLFCVDAMSAAQSIDLSSIADKLQSFVAAYQAENNNSQLISTYREGASSRTRSRSSREKRLRSLHSWIKES